MQTGKCYTVQHMLRPICFGICAGVLSTFFVLVLAFLVAFGNPTVLAKKVLTGADIFFRSHCYLWITGAVWVLTRYMSRKRRTMS